uniref:Phosphoinositide phospholipase C n=1 Tax=Naja naja TaxID=35670 RepID=A0A8C6XI47_NAJNA
MFFPPSFSPIVEKCMSSMQAGTQMIKLRGSSKGLVRFYYLDEHKSCIRWRPSRKNEKAKISIDSIQEVCEGKQSEIFQRYGDGSFDPNCCFTIYYGDHMESLDLVSSNGEEARMWITGLKYLMAGISDEDSLSKRQRTRDQYPFRMQTFDEADKNGDGSLSINEVLQLMHKLNVNLPRQKVKQMFKEADTDDNQGTLDFEEFCAFYKMMSTRRDLYLLMLTYSNHKDFLDPEDLKRFLDTEQKMSNVTKEHCLEIINQFEPCLENRQQGALGIDGFTTYMRSPAGDIFNPKHYHVNQDMTRPLSHYFITSSHNTYLMGDQLMSQSRVDMYGKKLPANISEDAEEGEVSDEDSADEMDDDCKLMNGDASSNRKRVENLAKKKLDSLIKESKIRDCEDQNNFAVTTLSSSGKLGNKPDLKKNKHEENLESGEDPILSKRHNRSLMGSLTKRKGPTGHNSYLVVVFCPPRTNRQKKTMKLSRALSDLVKYTRSVGIHDVESEISSSWQVSSFSETKAHQILQQKPAQYLRFNQHQLSRIYPSSYRVDSSNYNPQPFWNAGCQLVALNYQSEGRMLQLNRAKFSANGNCGYILKPKCMCQGIFNPTSEDPLAGQMKKQLVLRIISGQQLPKPRDSMLGDRGEIIDPFVEVEVIGLPMDCCKEQTRVVDDNGFNPMWEETLVFNIGMPEIALVRFLVWDHDPIGRDFIGQRTIAFTSMMPGYRHVYLEGMEEASVFVHVAVNDVCGKVKPALGLKSLFLRSPKQASLDSHAPAFTVTASAHQKLKKPKIALDARGELGRCRQGPHSGRCLPPSEPIRRSSRICLQEPAGQKQGLFTRIEPGRMGMATYCMKCVVGSSDSPEVEGQWSEPGAGQPASGDAPHCGCCGSSAGEERAELKPWGIQEQPRARSELHLCTSYGATRSLPRTCQPFGTSGKKKGDSACLGSNNGSVSSSSSSLDSLESPDFSKGWPESARKQAGTLQREMNALFSEKMEEIRSKSPIFFTGKIGSPTPDPLFQIRTVVASL